MKNKNIAEVFERLDQGEITLEEANRILKEEGFPYHLDPWRNHIGRAEEGAGLMDTGTGTLDKVEVIEDKGGLRLADPAFDPVQCRTRGGEPPCVLVQYGGAWHQVSADDGVTLIRK